MRVKIDFEEEDTGVIYYSGDDYGGDYLDKYQKAGYVQTEDEAQELDNDDDWQSSVDFEIGEYVDEYLDDFERDEDLEDEDSYLASVEAQEEELLTMLQEDDKELDLEEHYENEDEAWTEYELDGDGLEAISEANEGWL